ncbi:Crotonobetainyl-CoA:carnitine CoA-transferase CaiB [Parafrankia irregularis]|uniref:Crotonobetainyl-CoA:carnitine CoA-transferase CaiB n=1 Tax=Parafrankia irregularis TaxID=795642 RepID=A0A0S4QW10_9ACTN|nr:MULTISPECIES: CoA transferase [Parafrankia]MBE3199976.1 CoA transferase [Parafrankia sp. CH37]CUU59278.1 Crotonobetainyl-CoA:carnitine CoA-transferase CaiB [Parafrankia irregularis]
MAELPFDGVRVVELSQWVLAPVAGALLADWGADVIRVERPGGDPYRGLLTQGIGADSAGGVNLSDALANRGKRSITLDLRTERGMAILHQLLGRAEVLITNMRQPALERLKLDADELTRRYPGLVYARGLGYGARGPEAGQAGYDASAFWARGGLAHILTQPQSASQPQRAAQSQHPTPSPSPEPIPQRGAMGDRSAAMALAFGIAAALVKRGRTGQGSVVDVSLLATAMWTLSSDLLSALQGVIPGPRPRRVNPVFGAYRTGDGRFIQLVFLESDRYWADFCRVLGREDLVDDPRFRDLFARRANADACAEILEGEFSRRTFAECRELLGSIDVPWAPVQAVEELLDDPQVIANDYIGEVAVEGGPTYRIPNVPVQFDGRPAQLRRAPENGEHTEQILLELGYTWEQIIELKDAGAAP